MVLAVTVSVLLASPMPPLFVQMHTEDWIGVLDGGRYQQRNWMQGFRDDSAWEVRARQEWMSGGVLHFATSDHARPISFDRSLRKVRGADARTLGAELSFFGGHVRIGNPIEGSPSIRLSGATQSRTMDAKGWRLCSVAADAKTLLVTMVNDLPFDASDPSVLRVLMITSKLDWTQSDLRDYWDGGALLSRSGAPIVYGLRPAGSKFNEITDVFAATPKGFKKTRSLKGYWEVYDVSPRGLRGVCSATGMFGGTLTNVASSGWRRGIQHVDSVYPGWLAFCWFPVTPA